MDFIGNAINTALSGVWDKIWFYVSFQFLDPIWMWGGRLALLYVVVLLFCWLFGTFWPVLRVIGGFLLVAATFGLFAYAQGAKEAREHDRKKKNLPPPKPKPPVNDSRWTPFG